MTLAGLVKHLAFVEDNWFCDVLLGVEMPEPWRSAPFDADPDWEWHSAVDDDPAHLVDLYRGAGQRSRDALAAADALDTPSIGADRRTGEQFSLRWIMLHMIEEDARHNGHADILREAIDGLQGV